MSRLAALLSRLCSVGCHGHLARVPRSHALRGNASSGRSASRHCRLLLERLEDRSLLTAGMLDTTFGNGGYVTTDFGWEHEEGDPAMAIQDDGKIVLAGLALIPPEPADLISPHEVFAIARYNNDGSLDESFGGDGQVTLEFDDVYDLDGRVLFPYDPPIPFDPDGDPWPHEWAGPYSGANCIALQPDGKMVVAGGVSYRMILYHYQGGGPIGWAEFYSDMAIARLNADGSLDTSFGDLANDGVLDGDGGKMTVHADQNENCSARSVVVQADGKIVLGGYANSDLGNMIVRLNSDGSLDDGLANDTTPQDSFGILGRQFIDFGLSARITRISLQPDGKIVAASDNTDDFAVARLNTNGSLDNTFDSDGVQLIDFGGHDASVEVAMQADGKIVVVGVNYSIVTGDYMAVARLNDDGTLDSTFDGDGKLTDTRGYGWAGLAIQPDGRIVAGGWIDALAPEGWDFALFRWNSDGTPDQSFGSNGLAPANLQIHVDGGALALQRDGKIVVGGLGLNATASDYDFMVARFHGAVDTDGDGIMDPVDTQPATYSDEFSDVANGGATTGTITTRGDQILTIGDSPDQSEGLLITADASGGTTPAAIIVEGTTFYLDAGESIIVTHGSVVINVLSGTVDVNFATESGPTVATASLSAGTELTFEPETVTFVAAPANEAPVEVILIGASSQEATATVSSGDAITFNPETFDVAAPPTNEAPVPIVVSTGEVITVNPGTTVHAATVLVKIAPESLNLDSNGLLTVFIYGTADFGAAQIDVSSVRFAGAAATQSSLLDANHDGKLDMQLKFRRQDTALLQLYQELLIDDHDSDGVLDSTRQTAQVAVTGETIDDAIFSGSDSINLFLAGRSLRNLLDNLFG